MTDIRTYTTLDRTAWRSGPWDREPFDKIQWVDEETDLDCLAVRNSIGAWCGYVGVGSDHPWFDIAYTGCTQGCGESWCGHSPESLIDVHGGITYSDRCQEGPEDHSICHVPMPGRPDPVWWFGWDACHAGDIMPGYESACVTDRAEYRTLEYVRRQCRDMARQLAERS